LQVINEKIITTYFDKTQTSIYTFEFETDATSLAIVIPCQFIPQYSKAQADSFDVIDQISKPTYKLNQLNLIKQEEQRNTPIKPRIFNSFSLELLSPNSNQNLDDWIISNGFNINNNIRSALYEYQQNNWYFVVSKLNIKDFDVTTYRNLRTGYVAPIKISYQTNRAVIPEKVFFSFYQNENLYNYQKPTKFTFYNFANGQTMLEGTKIERSNWVENEDLSFAKTVLDLPNKGVFLTRSIKLANYNDNIGDLAFKYSEKNIIIGSDEHGNLEICAWVLILFTLLLITIIFSPFGILFYLSSLLIHSVKSIVFKYIYFTLLLISFVAISASGFYAILATYRFSDVLVDTLLGLFKYDIKLFEIRYSLMIAFSIITLINLVILFLSYRKIVISQKEKKERQSVIKPKITKFLDIHRKV